MIKFVVIEIRNNEKDKVIGIYPSRKEAEVVASKYNGIGDFSYLVKALKEL